jgi:hypothetical protein
VVNPAYTPTPNEIQQATNDFVMGRLGWRWTIIPRLLVETHVAYLLAPDSWSNVYRQSLENDHDSEWVAGGTVVWSWQRDYVLEGRVWVPT